MSLSFSAIDMASVASDIFSELLVSASLLVWGYVALALPATRLILCERDDQLSRGIQAACRIAASKHKNLQNSASSETNGRVVAVLGLLHVNGVAQRLLTQHDELSENKA